MIYYSDYDFVCVDILKNGSTGLKKIFKFVLGREPDELFFIRKPQIHITVVRNPYKRLITQFYHINRIQLWKDFKHTVHHPFFKKWVKEIYGDGYNGNDGHLYNQTHFLQFYENPIDYKIFKLEELAAHELFFFLYLTEEYKIEIDNEYKKIIDELEKNTHHATNNLIQGVWQSYYDVETIEICNKYYANDFVAFNYEIIEPEEFKPIYFEYKPKLI